MIINDTINYNQFRYSFDYYILKQLTILKNKQNKFFTRVIERIVYLQYCLLTILQFPICSGKLYTFYLRHAHFQRFARKLVT